MLTQARTHMDPSRAFLALRWRATYRHCRLSVPRTDARVRGRGKREKHIRRLQDSCPGDGIRAHIRFQKINEVESVSYEPLSRQLSEEMAAVREIAVGLTPVRCLLLRNRHSTEWRGSCGVASRATLGHTQLACAGMPVLMHRQTRKTRCTSHAACRVYQRGAFRVRNPAAFRVRVAG